MLPKSTKRAVAIQSRQEPKPEKVNEWGAGNVGVLDHSPWCCPSRNAPTTPVIPGVRQKPQPRAGGGWGHRWETVNSYLSSMQPGVRDFANVTF